MAQHGYGDDGDELGWGGKSSGTVVVVGYLGGSFTWGVDLGGAEETGR